MAGNDPDLLPFGELMLSAAEEYAIHTNHGINNNFIKMSSVFNLDNQKKLIMLMKEAQEENEREVKRKQDEIDAEELKEKAKKDIETGKSLYEEKLKDSTGKTSFDAFNKEFSENDIRCLKAFFFQPDDETTEGKDAYKELIEKDPIYKYLIDSDTSLNNLLTSINDLKVVEISNSDEFYENIAQKEQTLYSIMAERSIRDAVKSNTSEEYFGVRGVKVDESAPNFIDESIVEDKKKGKLYSILNSAIDLKGKDDKKYFLTFNGSGSGLFDILHNDFKTSIFKDSGEYESEISTESKRDIMKIIHKNVKLGNSISTMFSEYLVRLEAHMLLKNKESEPWFVAKTNDELKNCFDPVATKLPNKHAFVEINSKDYEDIKSFLSKYHSLSDKDFDVETSDTKETKKE